MRFFTGVQIFSLQRFESINANGRSTSRNRSTGEMRAFRTVTETRFLEHLPQIISGIVNQQDGEIRLSLDFSTMNNLQIASLNVTTGKGRSLPIWLEAYTLKPRKNSMIPRLISTLEDFLEYIENIERLTITMDRWFASPKLLRFLDKNTIKFVCRIKSGIKIEVPWDKGIKISEIANQDTQCKHADLNLRLVQSPWTEKMKDPEPWFLLTNDKSRTRQQVINVYSKRFEIEEYFKDLKWVYGYEWQRIKTPEVLTVIILFVILGWWLLKIIFWSEILRSRSKSIHQKKKLSIFRVGWEALNQALWPPELRLVPF